jgi:hypothetical protein
MNHEPPVGHAVFTGLRNALLICLPFWSLVVALIWWLA